MRSAALTAASVVGTVSAATSGTGNSVTTNINNAINGCVNTCQPILSVSSQCGFPVPSDPTIALNPVAWGNLGSWGGVAGTAGTSGWGGFGGFPGFGGAAGTSGWGNGVGGGFGGFGGGWKKSKRASTTTTSTAGGGGVSLNGGFLGGNWGSSWNSQLQCVCNEQSFDLSQVGPQCLTCVNNALLVGGNVAVNGYNVAAGNPCKFISLSHPSFQQKLTSTTQRAQHPRYLLRLRQCRQRTCQRNRRQRMDLLRSRSRLEEEQAFSTWPRWRR
jgi:hypothetical protein